MFRRRCLVPALAGLALLLFAAGVWRLFVLRFEAGDLFPSYSSLRTDPLGAKALFEGFDRLEGRRSVRHYKPLSRLSTSPGSTLFFIGADRGYFRWAKAEFFESLEAFAAGGGRLVVTFFPHGPGAEGGREKPAEPEGGAPATATEENARGESPEDGACGSGTLRKRWGICLGSLPGPMPDRSSPPDDARRHLPAAILRADLSLEESLPWSSRLSFTDPGREWSVVYELGGSPVVVERRFGQGSIVLMADSYLLSNEAMQHDRAPGLLAWLAGDCRLALFEESHLGVREQRGIASLARRYRLGGLLFGLLILGSLFIWKNATSFVPRERPGEEGPAAGRGHDAHTSFINLLRRYIPSRDLLGMCLREWENTFPRRDGRSADGVKKAREIARRAGGRKPDDRNPLAGYRAVTGILKGEKRD